MDAGELIGWALCIGIAVNVFFSLTGIGELISIFIGKSSSKKDMENKIEKLESRIIKLESGS
jgi:hypothetical protein